VTVTERARAAVDAGSEAYIKGDGLSHREYLIASVASALAEAIQEERARCLRTTEGVMPVRGYEAAAHIRKLIENPEFPGIAFPGVPQQ
jgi:hypothetical protein